MFGFFTDAVENALDIGANLLEGESPTKRQIADLIDSGITIYAISEATGIAVSVLQDILDGNHS